MSFRTVRTAGFRKLASAVFLVLGVVLAASARKPTPEPAGKDRICFLFAYAKGNAPDPNQLCYAVGTDGRHFFALNSGMPVIYEKTPSGTVGIRQSDLLRAGDGGFRMVATDTPAFNDAAGSGRGLLLMKSDDLIGWSQKTIDFPKQYPDLPRMQDLRQVWAPHAIYDPSAKKYLVYFTLVFRDGGGNNKIFGAYANADFTGLEGEPRLMFEWNGTSTVDTAIIPSDG